MCGISGFNWPDETIVKKMNLALKNRGPDGEGIYVDNMVSLGHRRLAIIDLSEKGKQPMCNEDGTIWLTYNGEIYNFGELKKDLIGKGHIFKSTTDSEIIVHAYEEYGIECTKHFNGMWAFCIYDSKRKNLVLSRDRFGIKPLYYYHNNQTFIFSSMIAGILCHDIPTAPNERAILEYLAFNLEQYDEHTFFDKIYSLNPGTTLVYDLILKQANKHRYYNLEPRGVQDENTIRDAFIESVRLRTVADVPIGSCLSGGIDSSAIVCVLDKLLKSQFKTFSLVVPNSHFDESKYIKEIGNQANIKQFFTTVEAGFFLDEVHDFIEAQEEPVRGISPYAQYRVMKLAHEQGMKVLLDGQGGDEIFAGYKYYFSFYFYELLKKWQWLELAKELALSRDWYSITMLGFQCLPRWTKYSLWKRIINPWVNNAMLDSISHIDDPRWHVMSLSEGLKMTILMTSLPQLLMLEDKNSMRWSIETRIPFLDFNLVEAAMGCTSRQRLHNGGTKVIFRKAIEGLLPPLIVKRKDKIGFMAPSDELFRGEKVITFSQDIILSESFRQRPYWKWDKVKTIFDAHTRGGVNEGDTIWKWINTELWLRRYFGS